jgi:serine/threonine protein phosphatase PrpC
MGSARGSHRAKHTPNPGSSFTLGFLSQAGRRGADNQDAYCALVRPKAPPGTDLLLAVADGVGGHRAGGVASALAIHGLMRRLALRPGADSYGTFLEGVVQQVNAGVYRKARRPETFGMATTLTAVLLVGSSLLLAHVGDSRAYLLRKGELCRLTQDHTWVTQEVTRGALTPEDARAHPRRNILLRAVGQAPRILVDSVRVEVTEGDRLLLCSDGLHGLVTDEEMRLTLGHKDPQAACRSLVARAQTLGGHDDITVVVAKINLLGRGLVSPDASQALRRKPTSQRLARLWPREKISRILGLPLSGVSLLVRRLWSRR